MATAVAKASNGTVATAPKVPSYAPNQTLYITNLPSTKISKSDLRTSLYHLFSTHGPVLDIIALRTSKMRGQAHVVYRDINTATQAMRALQGFVFFGMEMKIAYAKSKSDTLAKLDGTFKQPSAQNADVGVTELQQSIFSGPPRGDIAALPAKPLLAAPAQDADSPAGGSVAGQKRRREEEEEVEEDDEGSDVAMEEDSDDDDE